MFAFTSSVVYSPVDPCVLRVQMAPKRPVPLGWELRVSRTWGKLFYCNLITGDFQLDKPTSQASLCTDEEFSLYDDGFPLRRKKPKMIRVRHILIKHHLSDFTPMCRMHTGEYATRSEKQAYNLAKDIRLEILSHKITFDEAAFKYSESSTAFSGGRMGPIFKGLDMDEIFDETAFDLEICEISQPVETSIGYHIIQRIG